MEEQRPRVYFDTTVWNLVADHYDRPRLVRYLERNTRFRARPSVINLFEAIRAEDDVRRVKLCSAILETADRSVLAHPMVLLAGLASAVRAGEDGTTIENDEESGGLLTLASQPGAITSSDRRLLTAWVEGQEVKRLQLWNEIAKADWRIRDLAIERKQLLDPAFLKILTGFRELEHLELGLNEIAKLVDEVDTWRATAASIAVMLEAYNRLDPSNRQIDRQPNVLDLQQLAYLGGCIDFVTRDAGLLAAAERMEPLFDFSHRIMTPERYLARLGFPLLG
jgi:hypothetical protein